MSNFTPPGFDEDYGAPIDRPIETPRLVVVLSTAWCETCWTDAHDECHGQVDMVDDLRRAA